MEILPRDEKSKEIEDLPCGILRNLCETGRKRTLYLKKEIFVNDISLTEALSSAYVQGITDAGLIL